MAWWGEEGLFFGNFKRRSVITESLKGAGVIIPEPVIIFCRHKF